MRKPAALAGHTQDDIRGACQASRLRRLGERMRNWVESDYQAIVFERDSEVLAYALIREEQESVYLRQFFVQRAFRRSGIGRQCIDVLLSEVLPPQKRIRLDVLSGNSAAIEFWRAVGFSDYCLTLERPPRSDSSSRS